VSEKLHIYGEQHRILRYGENPQQTPATHYRLTGNSHRLAIHNFQLLGNTNPGWVNTIDVHRAVETVVRIAAGFPKNFDWVPWICVIVKHGNVCGAAVGSRQADALFGAIAGDPADMFGGVVLTNFTLREEHVETLKTRLMFGGRRVLGGIIAPAIEEGAVELALRKDGKCFALANPALSSVGEQDLLEWGPVYRFILGGVLEQPQNTFLLDFTDPRLTFYGPEIPKELKVSLVIAQAVAWASNSNTTTLVRERQVIGNGVGQQGRGRSCKLAIERAAENLMSDERPNIVAATDSFFPQLDGPSALNSAGVSAIFATSGSVADERVIKFCTDSDISLVLIPDTVGRGFAAH